MRNISGRKIVVVVSAVFAVLSFAAPVLHAQWVTATIAAGSGPDAVAVNPATNMVYVVNSNSNNVSVINGATNATSTVSVGYTPTAIAVNPTSSMKSMLMGEQQRNCNQWGHQRDLDRELRQRSGCCRRQPGHQHDLRGQLRIVMWRHRLRLGYRDRWR